MALKKVVSYKGYSYEYWKILQHKWDAITNTTSGRLGLFKDRATREAGLENEIVEMAHVFSFEGDLALAALYPLITASDLLHLIVQKAEDAVLDEDGNVVTPAIPEFAVDQEQNWFADAESV